MARLNHQITPPPQRLDPTHVLALIATLRTAYVSHVDRVERAYA
jgi:hypothetical protein